MVVTIIKCFIGSGVLFLPKAFANGGWLFSTLSFAVCAYMTNICVMKLIACRLKMPPGTDYGAMGFRVAGWWGQAAVNTSLVLSQAGFCCVYISFVARNVIQLFNDGPSGCWVQPSALPYFIAFEFLILAPLTWVRRLSSFAPTNLAANCLIACGIAGVLAYSLAGMAGAPGPRGGGSFPPSLPAIAPNWALMLGTAVYAFEGAGMVVPMVNDLPLSDRARFPAVFAATLAGVSLLYVVVGLVPYMYLVGYSTNSDCVSGAASCVQDTITLNLPHVWWSYALTAGYCVALLFSYPLMMFPAMKVAEAAAQPYIFAMPLGKGGDAARRGSDIIEEEEEEEGQEGRGGSGAAEGAALLVGQEASEAPGAGSLAAAALSAAEAEEAAEALLDSDRGWGYWKRNAFRSSVVAVTLLVAYVGAPQLDNMVALIGAFCCTPM